MKTRGLILNDSDGGGAASFGSPADAPVTSKIVPAEKRSQGNGKKIPTLAEMEATLAENKRTNKYGFDDWTNEQWEEAFKNW
jgi:hypothetical protein